MIPKIFHQIWINKTSPELPEKFRAYRDGWLVLHPDWEYKLWNLDNLDFTPRRIDLVSNAPNYAQMADVLRYEILLRHGGVYLDTDFECLRNIDPKLIGVKSFSCSEDGYSITNAIICAEPNSIYMERCVSALPERVGETNTVDETGPGLLTRVLLVERLAGNFVLLPREWFYPYRCHELHRTNESFSQAYAVHRWAGSWGNSDNRFFTRVHRKIKRVLRLFGAMTPANPRVSVIMPVFNAVAYLAEAMSCVFTQILQEWELIVINAINRRQFGALGIQFIALDAHLSRHSVVRNGT